MQKRKSLNFNYSTLNEPCMIDSYVDVLTEITDPLWLWNKWSDVDPCISVLFINWVCVTRQRSANFHYVQSCSHQIEAEANASVKMVNVILREAVFIDGFIRHSIRNNLHKQTFVWLPGGGQLPKIRAQRHHVPFVLGNFRPSFSTRRFKFR